jgi:hypothetical protein
MSRDDRKDPTSERAPGRDGDLRPDPSPDEPADARELARAASFGALVDRLVAGQPLPPAMTPDERALIETAGMVRASTRPVALAADRQRALVDSVLGSVLGSAAGPARGSASGPAAGPALGSVRGSAAGAVLGSVSGPGSGSAGARGGAVDATPAPAPAGHTDAGVPRRGAEAEPGGRAGLPDGVIDMREQRERRRGRFFRVLPWAVATASVAAALVLVLWQGRGRGLSPAAPPLVAESAGPALDAMHRSRPASDLVGEIPRARADAARARIDMIYADRMIGYRDLRLRGGRL